LRHDALGCARRLDNCVRHAEAFDQSKVDVISVVTFL
jgi:hypothetical protein